MQPPANAASGTVCALYPLHGIAMT